MLHKADGKNCPSLRSLFLSFVRLGLTAFGGPAMVPYIGKMAVEQKRWLDIIWIALVGTLISIFCLLLI